MHLIVTDSRGKGLGDVIRSKIKTNEIFDILVRDGASFLELVDAASSHLNGHAFDIVYIPGGVCDITTKNKKTKEVYYQWKRGEELHSHFIKILKLADEQLRRDFPASKIVFCPLVASELHRVLTKKSTKEEDQLSVEEAVWGFNSMVFKINKQRELYSPALHHQVHRFCKGKKRAYYHHLSDGLHLTDFLKNKWADEFIKVMAQN